MLCTLLFCCIRCSAAVPDNDKRTQTVDSLNVERYMGRWYEIARYNHRFERGLQAVYTDYSLKPDGTIRVVNSGRKGGVDGPLQEAIGRTRKLDPKNPGKLQVSFFLWFFGDYYILNLDQQNYSYAVIGSSSVDYLWILSRTPQLPEATLASILADLRDRGYDTTKLIWVEHRK